MYIVLARPSRRRRRGCPHYSLLHHARVCSLRRTPRLLPLTALAMLRRRELPRRRPWRPPGAPPSTDSRSLLGAFPMRASHPVRREVPSAAANSHGTELPWPRVPLPAMDARSSSSVRHPKIPSRGPELHLLPPLMELRLPSSIAGEGRQSGRERGGTRSCRAGQLIRARARRARGWRACD